MVETFDCPIVENILLHLFPPLIKIHFPGSTRKGPPLSAFTGEVCLLPPGELAAALAWLCWLVRLDLPAFLSSWHQASRELACAAPWGSWLGVELATVPFSSSVGPCLDLGVEEGGLLQPALCFPAGPLHRRSRHSPFRGLSGSWANKLTRRLARAHSHLWPRADFFFPLSLFSVHCICVLSGVLCS